MRWETFPDYEALSAHAAEIFVDAVRQNPRIVLGLPTGRSPIGMYRRVVATCSREDPCFGDVTTFNLDEYVGIPRTHPASYFTFMHEQLFSHVDIDPQKIHIPNGMATDIEGECERYEADIVSAGGIDLMFLGVGRNGHIGFNEPGSPFAGRTRLVELTPSTREANAPFFPGTTVPTQAITMGIASILESRRIVLLASGEGKRPAVERLRSGVIDEAFPASALWKHDDVTVLLTEPR